MRLHSPRISYPFIISAMLATGLLIGACEPEPASTSADAEGAAPRVPAVAKEVPAPVVINQAATDRLQPGQVLVADLSAESAAYLFDPAGGPIDYDRIILRGPGGQNLAMRAVLAQDSHLQLLAHGAQGFRVTGRTGNQESFMRMTGVDVGSSLQSRAHPKAPDETRSPAQPPGAVPESSSWRCSEDHCLCFYCVYDQEGEPIYCDIYTYCIHWGDP